VGLEDQGESDGTSILLSQVHPNPYAGPLFELLITRDWITQVYTYAVASAPFVMAAMLLHILRITRRFSTEPVKDLPVLLVGLPAVFLTVLPLRAVLVPADIPGVTRTDLILGLGLMILLTIIVVAYQWIASFKRSTN